MTLFTSLIIKVSLFYPLINIADEFNKYCQSFFDTSHYSYEVHQALVCGTSIDASNPIRQHFIALGVIHLLVASGAHLQFIKSGLSKACFFLDHQSRAFKLLFNTLATTYIFVTGFNPPLVRAFFNQLANQSSKTKKMYWSKPICVLVSTCICLLAQPLLWESYSLVLSWTVCSLLTFNCKPLKKSILIYFMTLPILMQFQWVHPISILANLLFAPVFALFYFPLSFGALVSTKLEQLSWIAWDSTSFLMYQLTHHLELQFHTFNTPHIILWLYCFTIQACSMIHNQRYKRRFFFK